MKKSIVIYSHVAFWILVITLNVFSPMIFSQYLSVEEFSKARLYILFLTPFLFYVSYFTIMKLLKSKKLRWYIMLSILLIYVVLFFLFKNVFAYGIIFFYSTFIWFLIGGLFRFFIDWFQKRNNVLLLKKETAESQLALLRTQINPHFLFNTLNNIDSLIKFNPNKASESLSKLSEIMRYMLKEENENKVLLKEEVDFLENYISLERLRLKKDDFLRYKFSGNFENKYIHSMLLIPFIENTFKHSVDSDITDRIIIQLHIDKNTLLFTCENRFIKKEKTDSIKGIGLNTVKKRLNLLYPNKHKLNITDDNQNFKVKLTLCLHEN